MGACHRIGFIHRISLDEPTGCWNWRGPIDKGGYGKTKYNGKFISAHRLSAILWLRIDRNDPRQVMHKCDNPGCVNPDHLRIGTYSENVLDSISKGRNAFVGGEKNGHSKLTDAAVREIRKSTEVQSVLARRFGVNQSQISRAKTAKRWRHLA